VTTQLQSVVVVVVVIVSRIYMRFPNLQDWKNCGSLSTVTGGPTVQ